ncbi:MAG: hypothetical protein ACD_75C00177G0001 [uncultured bacterium]|nr:MAG: hypothetical protein ACD_75C00177G0001 [uncultured bacterium]
MPLPVSLTAKLSITCSSTRLSVSALMSRTPIRMMPPGGVNFIELLIRLVRICCRRSESPKRIRGVCHSISTRSSMLFSAA